MCHPVVKLTYLINDCPGVGEDGTFFLTYICSVKFRRSKYPDNQSQWQAQVLRFLQETERHMIALLHLIHHCNKLVKFNTEVMFNQIYVYNS